MDGERPYLSVLVDAGVEMTKNQLKAKESEEGSASELEQSSA